MKSDYVNIVKYLSTECFYSSGNVMCFRYTGLDEFDNVWQFQSEELHFKNYVILRDNHNFRKVENEIRQTD